MVAIQPIPSKKSFSKKRPTIPFHYYRNQLTILAKCVVFVCYIHFTFFIIDHVLNGSPSAKCGCISGCLVTFVGIIYQKLVSKKQHTIESFFTYRYILAVAVMLLRFLLTLNSNMKVYSSWTNVIVFTGILSILSYLPIGYASQISGSQVHYSSLKTTRPTIFQALFIALFFISTEAYYIYRCFEDIDIGFNKSTRSFSSLLNVLQVLILGEACRAYNSDKLEFCKVDPISEKVSSGVCSWDGKSGRWEYVEKPRKEVTATIFYIV